MDNQRKHYPEDHWLRSHDSEKAFHEYMDQQGKAYSIVKNSFIQELLGDLRGKRFLDYGCGGGIFSVHAAKEGAAEVIGVDALETALATASFFARNEGVQNICRFIHSSDFPTRFQQPRFDVILMKDVLEHVEDDQGLLEAASQAIVPGGILVLSTQNSLSLNFLIQGTYRRGIRRDKHWFGWDETHLRFYTPMSLNKHLKKSGFSSVAWRSVYIIPYKLQAPLKTGKKFIRVDALSWIDRALGSVFPYNRLGWNIVVKAEASPLISERIKVDSMPLEQVPVAPLVIASQSVRFQQQTPSTGIL